MESYNIPPEDLSKLKERIKIKKCFYPRCECNDQKIINSHSIQKNRILKYLADNVNGQEEVYFLDDEFDLNRNNNSMVSKQKTKRVLHSRGIKNASVFTGFCGDHDKKVFQEIEDKEYIGSSKQKFLFTYRSYAYSIHKKNELESFISKEFNDIKSFFNNVDTASSNKIEDPAVHTILSKLDDLMHSTGSLFESFLPLLDNKVSKRDSLKAVLDSAILTENYDAIYYWSKSVQGIYPVAASSILQYLDEHHIASPDGISHAAEISITVYPDEKTKTTHFIIGAIPGNPNIDVLYSKLNTLPESSLLKFISDLLLYRGSNIYISPRIINRMSEAEREILIDIRNSSEEIDIGLPEIPIHLFNERFLD